MSEARSRWVLQRQPQDKIAQMAEVAAVSPLIATILLNRSVAIEDAVSFLRPQLRDMPDPWLMADLKSASERIVQAIEERQRVCIYGDYDVDGVTSSALLYDYLRRVGANVEVFLPDRFTDGYGLHADRLLELADQGVQLFISVDCGTKALEPIRGVVSQGIDFIVVDHHLLGDELPVATALINPHRPDCQYPESDLCAAGVATVLVQGIRRILVQRELFTRTNVPGLQDLIELTGLGTIADMVPLHGLNRTFAWHGLHQLSISTRPGVLALANQARLQGKLHSDHVGFALGPRINAAGRVSDARTAFELLTTTHQQDAEQLAERVDLENNKRRNLQRQAEQQAITASEQTAGTEHAVVVANEQWHSGVVGIVASRLKDRYYVPTFVLNIQDGIARGSGRSIPGYDLVEGLNHIQQVSHPGILTRFGGHYFAAGVTLSAADVPRFRQALIEHVSQTLNDSDRVPQHLIDATLKVSDLSLDLIDQIQTLEPFGKGNRKPLFLLRDVEMASIKFVGKDNNKVWMQADLVDAHSDRPIWSRPRVRAFGHRDLLGQNLGKGDVVDILCRLEANVFRGRRSLQASLVEIAAQGSHLIE
ncbi:MAG TPA: single-stranded-DNA-specific exonuclease RecJ [Myxococcales bacterium]|nr:single-stranded-DNA-specific exonuclease RecJ [Myxococcales bacterium]HAN31586.1 single-stranded-DNA-specific exonuclease RecJ [Myxococcales bacterium]